MTDTALDLDGVRCLSVRLVTCWRGAWFADCDLDPDSNPVTAGDVPSGQVTITIALSGTTPITLTGTVEPASSGRIVSTIKVRVVGGLGWAKTGTAQAWHSDAGISAITVEQAMAAAVGETVVDSAPPLLGIDFSVTGQEPASACFGSREWYVDTAGVTQVQSRPTAAPDASVELIDWDPLHAHGTLAADTLVLPGTQLSDPRFDGPITVRDAVQTWDGHGTRVEIWCGPNPAGRLVSSLTNIVRALGGIAHLKRYRYRIVTQAADGRLTLQALPNSDGSPSGAPNLDPVSVAPGMSGLSALYALSSACTVAFCAGDPAQAFVESFDSSTLPTEVTIDASGVVHVGPKATSVELGGGGAPVARSGDSVYVVGAFTGVVAGAPAVGTVMGVGSIIDGSGIVSCG